MLFSYSANAPYEVPKPSFDNELAKSTKILANRCFSKPKEYLEVKDFVQLFHFLDTFSVEFSIVLLATQNTNA